MLTMCGDKVCVDKVCVDNVVVTKCGGGSEEEKAEEPGIQNQKQEPHTKMWGKKRLVRNGFPNNKRLCNTIRKRVCQVMVVRVCLVDQGLEIFQT